MLYRNAERVPNMLGPGFVRAVRLNREKVSDWKAFPFCVPAVKKLKRLELHPAVTFLIGENGIGKSTLIEAIAIRLGFNPEGGSKNFQFKTRESHSELYRFLTIERAAARPMDGFFLRAESFYTLATEIDVLDKEPHCPPLLPSYGGKGLHEQSHGQSLFSLLRNRLGGQGVYIFDEPEAALSPSRQMSVLTLMHDLVRDHSQFIISTHSPILMAYPHSCIYVLSEKGMKRVKYEDTEHFRVTRDFLNRHEKMVHYLLSELPLDP
jgi:predicted ATPase